MTIDQIHTILHLPERNEERFRFAANTLGLNQEFIHHNKYRLPTQGRGFDAQLKIAEVLQVLGAIDDWGIEADNALVVWL